MKTVLELEELANQAIKAALSQDWRQAVSLNEELLADDPDNLEALNRLGRARQELGEIELAKHAYEHVLSLDGYNAIAQKNLEKLAQGRRVAVSSAVAKEVFLEEPGKTRAVILEQPQSRRLAKLTSGQPLKLQSKDGRLAVATEAGDHVGFIPDDLGSHLLNLIHLGNTYSAHLMTISDQPHVFLREVSQSAQAAKFISFARSHGAHHNGSIIKEGLTTDEALQLDPASDDESDSWDADNSDDGMDLENPDDDFALDRLRDEDESSYQAY